MRGSSWRFSICRDERAVTGSTTTNWLTDAPLGEWYGVTTNDTGRVTVLFLANNELSGEIPSELGNLTNLETLSLWDNELRGEIPVELGVLANLKVLYLNNNELSGEIPSGLGNLTNLTTLALPNNELSGEIPSELGNLTNCNAWTSKTTS